MTHVDLDQIRAMTIEELDALVRKLEGAKDEASRAAVNDGMVMPIAVELTEGRVS